MKKKRIVSGTLLHPERTRKALRGSGLAPNATRFYTDSNLLAHYDVKKK